jgi:hypothetical protein
MLTELYIEVLLADEVWALRYARVITSDAAS